MVELYVRVRDNNLDAPPKEQIVRRCHRGDVIVWKSDGWKWSVKELRSITHRVIQVPMTNMEADSLVASELDPLRIKLLKWKRARHLDLDHDDIKSGTFKTFIADDTRTDPIFTFDSDKAFLLTDITIVKQLADDFVAVV